MSGLHLAQIRRHLQERYVPYLDLTGASQPQHQLSRAVAALALTEQAGLSEKGAAESVTDDPNDGGIDGVAYAADRATLVFVQSKWTEEANTGIALGDVLKFIDGVRRLVNGDWGTFGGKLASRRSEIEDVLFQAGTKIELVVVTSGTHTLPEKSADALGKFCSDMNDATEIATFLYLNQERLYGVVAASRHAQIDLGVNLRNWGSYQDDSYVSYYGTTSAQEVVEWYRSHGDLLFSRNIRGALAGTEVNAGIIETAATDPARFWFFNNGVTVIAESFERAPQVNQKSGNFQFRRASVVNGAQTVSSLVRAASLNPDLLASADVFVRFVTVEDPDGDFARLVTRRTNTQNRVGGREFAALDPEQERIRMEFAVSNLRYAYRAGETVADPAKGCDLSEATVALACAHGINETVLAKREISRLWEDTSKAPYKALFNPSVSGSYVWTAVELMRWVDDALESERATRDGRDKLIAVHGNRFILWAVLSYLNVRNIGSEHAFEVPFTKDQIATLTTKLMQRLVGLVAQLFSDAYPQPLFKNQTKCQILGALLMKSMQER